jgi:hypothetical protein
MKKLVIASVLALSTVFFVACNEGNAASKVNSEKLDKAKKRDANSSKEAAMIEFDKTVFDFGTVNEGDIVDVEYVVTNPGKTDLVILKASPSCGCTVPSWPKEPIKPGESAKVVAKFNSSGRPGKANKSITLFTNTAKGREVLSLKGNVTPKAK